MGGRSFLAGSGFAIVVAAALIASLSGCSASESLSPPPATPTPASTATPVPIEFVRFFDPDEPWATEAIWYEIAEVPGEWPSLVSLPSTLRDDDGSFVEGIWGDGARVLTGRLYFSPGEDYVGDVIERLINAGFASEHSYSNRAGSVDRLRFGDSRVEISGTSFGYAIVDVIEMADQPEHQVLRPQEVVTTREVVTPTSSTAEASTDAAATNPFGHLPLTESTTRVLTAQGGEFDAITLIDLDAYEAVTIPRVGQFEATVQGDVPIWYVDDRYHVRGVGWDGVQRFSTDFELDRWYRQVLPLAAGGVALVTSPDGSDPVTLTVLDANGNQRCQNLVGSFSRLVEQGDELWSTNGRRFSADTCVSLGDLSMQYPRWLASSTEVYSSEYDVENRTWSLVKWQSTGSEWVVASEIPLQLQATSVLFDESSAWLAMPDAAGSQLAQVSGTTNQLVESWPLFACTGDPRLVAVDNYVWAVNEFADCDQKIARFDPATGSAEYFDSLSGEAFDFYIAPDGLWIQHFDDERGAYFFSFERLRFERPPDFVSQHFLFSAMAVEGP